MPRKIYGGEQDFASLREGGYFYVDKTAFLKQWWQGDPDPDKVSLITRPRRFGKTLMLSTVEHFFSIQHAGRSDLFEGLDVWQDVEMREQQGKWPVIFLSLADVKGGDFATQRMQIVDGIVLICRKFREMGLPDRLSPNEQEEFFSISRQMDDSTAFRSLNSLCMWLNSIYGKKVIVLLDEYDTPLQEAWLNGFWPEMVRYLRNLLNSTFKTNLYLERGLLTGISRVSKESIFSDLNNIGVYTISTPFYSTAFGFTEGEVFAAMAERGLADYDGVRKMYDGYTFGNSKGIYNPWSICCYLKNPKLDTWWSNTSSNALVGKLVREGSVELKKDFQTLLEGCSITSEIDEQIVYDELGDDVSIWSLLLVSGYLKAESIDAATGIYTLSLTNGEVARAVARLVKGWFKKVNNSHSNFVRSLLAGDLRFMNKFMNDISYNCFSSFDTGNQPSQSEPERFYHGFVLGLLVDLRDRYILTSNRESGFGRYDVTLEPRKPDEYPAFIIEFKVHDPDDETDLKATVASALAQIEAKGYEQQLLERGLPAERIRKYGFAFRGKEVLIGQG